MGLRATLLALSILWPTVGVGQDWATREACTIPDDPRVHPEVFEPVGLADARQLAADIPNGVGKFWRIETAEGKVSHLWGTMHASDRVVLDLPDPVMDAINAATIVALEIDPRPETRAEFYAVVTDQSYWRVVPQNFSNLGIDRNVERAIRTRLDAMGWGYDAPDYLSLGIVAELLLSSPCEDFNYGVIPIQDSLIQTFAHINGARIVGLEETFRVQDFFDTPENRETALAMIEVYGSFLSPDLFAEANETAAALYVSGQMGLWSVWEQIAVADILGENRGLVILGRMDEYLLVKRNHDFLQAMEPLLAEGGAFVAVGAGHIPGEEGMIELLRAQGHDVTRVVLPGEVQ